MKGLPKILTASLVCVCIVSCSCGGKGGNRGVISGQQGPVSGQPSQAVDSAGIVTASEHPAVNIYMENSGSMNGYVDNGKSKFQQTVYNYLCDLKISGIPSEMNMHFINSEIVDKGNSIDAFINSLTPSDFKSAQGNKSTTDMASVFRQVLSETGDDTVSVFISDCIFSPGSVASPDAYLLGQQVGIKDCMADYLSSHDYLAVMVYRLSSEFNGTYYDYMNRPRKYVGKRPYYIWVIGHPVHLAKMRLNIPESKFLGGVENYWYCSSAAFPQDFDYGILPNPKKGDFSRNNGGKSISRCKTDKNGEFMFTIGVDLSLFSFMLGNDYLKDTDNYVRLVNKMPKDEIFIEISENSVQSSPATHNITLTTKGYVPKGNLEIALVCNTPQWAYELSDADDSSFDGTNDGKTYGLHYIFDGIQQAITAVSENHYASMKFNIN